MGSNLSINPWTQIWVKPRETIRAIIETNPGYKYPLLCFIYGFPMAMQLAQNASLGSRFPVAGIFIVGLFLAIVLGAIMINISAALFTWTGKWIGGVGTYQQVRAAVAWSNVPNVVNIGIWLIYIAAFGKKIFIGDFLETQFAGGQLTLIVFMGIIQLVVGIWAFIIMLKTLGEVQGFSAWKALLNILIPMFIIFIGVSILAWLFTLGTGTPK